MIFMVKHGFCELECVHLVWESNPREVLLAKQNPREAFFLAKRQALERLSSSRSIKPSRGFLPREAKLSRSDFLLLACRDHCQLTSFSFIQHLKNKNEKETHKTKITYEGKYNNKKDIRLPSDERLFKVTSLTVASPYCFPASQDAMGTSSDSSFLHSWVSSMSIFSPTR